MRNGYREFNGLPPGEARVVAQVVMELRVTGPGVLEQADSRCGDVKRQVAADAAQRITDGRGMLNAMRYHAQLKKLPGVEGFQGTPAQANAHYEKIVTPIAVRLGAIPIVSGEAAGVRGSDGGAHTNLLAFEPKVDDWSRVLVMRYPSRRAFFDLVSDPAYLDVMPYKLASLDVALVPVRAELVVPDLRWIVGLILVAAFLVVGWRLAGRRHGGDL